MNAKHINIDQLSLYSTGFQIVLNLGILLLQIIKELFNFK